jgi:hypothetical protein
MSEPIPASDQTDPTAQDQSNPQNVYAGLKAGKERAKQDIQNSPTESIEEYYNRMLDPDDKLPKIKLEEIPQREDIRKPSLNFIVKNSDGTKIGSINVNVGSWKMKIGMLDINLDETTRHQGYGRAAYKAVLEILSQMDYTLKSNKKLSRGSKPVWDWLVEKGVARQVNRHEVNELAEWHGYSEDNIYQTIPLPQSVKVEEESNE